MRKVIENRNRECSGAAAVLPGAEEEAWRNNPSDEDFAGRSLESS